VIPLLYLSLGNMVRPNISLGTPDDRESCYTCIISSDDPAKTACLINVNLGCKTNPRQQSFCSEKSKCHILINGVYMLSEKQRSLLASHQIPINGDAVIALYETGGAAALQGMWGEHNILIYKQDENSVECITSYFGMLPVYYAQGPDFLIISSNLALVRKNLNCSLNQAVQAQICLYNYPITDLSLLNNVQIIPPASQLNYRRGKISIESHWSPYNLLGHRELSFARGLEAVDQALEQAISRIDSLTDNCAISLTGGWDGRLVLSYLLKKKPVENILAYSFGTEEARDVAIPRQLSHQINLPYQAFILDDEYLGSDYVQAAIATALYSDGYRGVQKAHYYHAMSQLKHFSPAIVTGICGSNIMKGVATHPSVVFNQYILDLMGTADIDSTLERHYTELMSRSKGLFAGLRLEDFHASISRGLLSQVMTIKDYTERFSTFLLSFTERKYFGAEMTSYRHLVNNLSPFIDFDFIQAISRTAFYNGSKKSSGMTSNWKNSILYAKLIKKNSTQLADFPTDKGVTLRELLNPLYYPKVLLRKLARKKVPVKRDRDPYNTERSLGIFYELCKEHSPALDSLLEGDKRFAEGYLTVAYWYEYCNDIWG